MFESACKFFRSFTIADLEVGGAQVGRIDIEIASLTFPDLLRGQVYPDR